MLDALRTHLPLLRLLASLAVGVRKLRADVPADYSDFLEPHFGARRDALVLIGERSRFTWAELDDFAGRVAAWALGAGMQRGDVVALSMENRPEYVGIWIGLSRIGVVTALLNTSLRGERLAHCMREASARAWVVGVELLETASSALPHLEAPPPIFAAGLVGDRSPHESLAAGEVRSFDAHLAAVRSGPIDPALRSARRGADPMLLIYTSGTTGLPKAARISHLRVALAGMSSWKSQALGPEDRTYCCLPLYHSSGGVMAVSAALMSGGSIVLSRKFSASQFWSDCVRHEATSFQYVGELCRYLVNSPPHPDERRHRIRSALGNGLRPDVWKAFQERFAIPRVVEGYGATEGNLALINLSGRPGAVGQAPGIVRRALGIEIVRFDVEADAIVRGSDGRCIRCAPGEAGELLCRISDRWRFEGYTNRSATEKKILRDAFVAGDAYFRTGDLLRMDADGFYYFVDRIGDTFRWKGENVATSEVAEVIAVDPGVDEANVYGVAIPGRDGRAGMAALVVNEAFDLERLGRAIHDGLPPYARPLFLRILPRMEITSTFKHRKIELVREGFDPRELSDVLYFCDPFTNRYVPLDTEIFLAIESGQARI